MPNLAIAAELRKEFADHPHKLNFLYIGSKNRMDVELVRKAGINFKPIFTGKFRRYLSLQNFIDLFKIPIGVFQSIYHIQKFNPDVIFSKGGFVAVPVLLAGFILRKKIIIHESDTSPGLATKLTGAFADKILVSQEETIKKYPRKKRKKVVCTGLPIRPEVLKGTKQAGYELTKFSPDKPVILVTGGSLGAMKMNDVIWASLTRLIPDFQVVHICGKGKSAKTFSNFLLHKLQGNYIEFEYVDKELADIYAITDIMVTRAGANSLAEVEALGIPAIIVPLGQYSRGDQVENAQILRKKDPDHYKVIRNKNLNSNRLINAVQELSKQKKHPAKEEALNPIREIVKILLSYR